MRARAAVLAALALAAGRPSRADEVRLSLAEAVDRAVAQAPRLAGLRSLEEAARAGWRAARAARLPVADLGAAYTRASDVPELAIVDPSGARRVLFPNIPDIYRIRAGVQLPLYTGGRIGAAITAAAEETRAAQLDRAGAEHDLVLEARSAYWSLITARESARVLAEAAASFEAHLTDARHRQEEGLAARNELLAVQVERDRAELARLAASNAAALANANLLLLTGLPPEATVVPTESLALTAVGSDPLSALLAVALAGRPEVMALRARAAAADAAARAVRSGTLPQASLAAGYEFANPNPRILPLVPEWNGTWSVGVSLALTAFDGGRTAAAAAQARAQADALRHQVEDLERRIRLEVTQRSLDLGTAQAAVAVADRNLEAAQENLKVAQDRYKEGLIPSAELLDAETALLRAGLDRTSAVTQFHLARAGLERSVGR